MEHPPARLWQIRVRRTNLVTGKSRGRERSRADHLLVDADAAPACADSTIFFDCVAARRRSSTIAGQYFVSPAHRSVGMRFARLRPSLARPSVGGQPSVRMLAR